ncbi:hypothetical protein WG954_20855 [Lacibacter sp. H375]|uniref:hypothetical protein n=1 Tax=Lacibacter sp. H375 TaxID=3133424 RepID=UPI0030C2C536
MKKLFTITGLMLLTFFANAQSDYLISVSETKSFSEKITKLFFEQKISEATNELKKFWPIPENEVSSFEEKTIKYLNLISDRFGNPINYVKIKNEVILDFAIRETFLIRYDNTAIRVLFTYYKNKNGWIVNAFKWDDTFTEEFK